MGLVINTNVAAFNTSRILRRSTLALNRSLERLSSGLRINRASDDAAGLAIAEGFSSRVRGLAVAQRNAQDGISLLQTTEGALGEVTNILQRMRELAVQAANGTNNGTNRDALDLEIDQLKAQVTFIANNTEFNGINPLAGTVTQTITLQVGVEKGQTIALAIKPGGIAASGINITGVDVSTIAAAENALATLDTALETVGLRRASLGASQNRLEFTINTLAIEEENSIAAESAIRDANIATETILFTRNQILVTAGTAILAQANLVPQTALQLLG